MRTRTATAALVVLGLGAAACGDDDGGSSLFGPGTPDDLASAVATMPADADGFVVATLHTQAREALDVDDDVRLIVRAGLLLPPFPGQFAQIVDEELGVDVDGDLAVSIGDYADGSGGPGNETSVLVLEDGVAEELLAAVADDDVVAGVAEEVDADEGTYLRYLDDDLVELEDAPEFAPRGLGFRSALLANGAYGHTTADDAIEALLEVASGGGESLADGPIGRLAESFDSASVLAAAFTGAAEEFESEDAELPEWEAVGLGLVDVDLDDGDGRVAVGYVFDEEGDAEDALDVVTGLVEDGPFEGEVVSADAAAGIALVVFDTDRAGAWNRPLIERNAFVTHGG